MKVPKKLFSMIGVLAMLAVLLVPATAFAAEVTGNVTASNTAPTITSVTLQNSEGTGVSAMTPQTEFLLEIVAGDVNTIDDISTIDIWIYHDTTDSSPGSPPGSPTWDSDDGVIYKWDKTGGWTMENSAITTSWAVTTGNCTTPGTFTGLSGTWKLCFTPGKLAVESTGADTDEWNFKVTVTDAADAPISNQLEVQNSMAAYSEISTSVASITFGSGVTLGNTAYIDTPDTHNVTTQVLANDAYALQSNTAETWTGSGTLTLDASGTPDAAGEFGLNIDDEDGGSGAPNVTQAVTTSPADITDHAADTRVTTAASADEATVNQDLYMSLTLYSTGIPTGAYNGTITFTVVNS